jgi:hypothetical protein
VYERARGRRARRRDLVWRLVVNSERQTPVGIEVAHEGSDMVIILRSRVGFHPNQNPGTFLRGEEEFGEIVRVPDGKDTIQLQDNKVRRDGNIEHW